jgi:hypothetical protein
MAPPKGLLAPLEERFRKSDYSISELVATILGSRLFFSSHAYWKRVKWPVEYALEAYHAVTQGRVLPNDFVAPLSKMGQALFAPPNVKGWRTGTDWLNSATLLARNNFAETVALGEWSKYGSPSYNKSREPVPAEDNPVGKDAAKSSPPPPPPRAEVDPVATIYASKPKDIPALAARMSELLYGDRISTVQIAKIEKFLNEPLTAPKSSDPIPKKGIGKSGTAAVPDEAEAKVESSPKAPTEQPKEPPKPPKEPKDPPKEAKDAGPINMESPAFKARVREALHAMMCLPEYQLN